MDDVLPPTAALMSAIYEEHKSVHPIPSFPSFPQKAEGPDSKSSTHVFVLCRDEDGFLYVTYSGENTFGAGSLAEVEESS